MYPNTGKSQIIEIMKIRVITLISDLCQTDSWQPEQPWHYYRIPCWNPSNYDADPWDPLLGPLGPGRQSRKSQDFYQLPWSRWSWWSRWSVRRSIDQGVLLTINNPCWESVTPQRAKSIIFHFSALSALIQIQNSIIIKYFN